MAKKKGVDFNFFGNLVTGAGRAGSGVIESGSKLAVGTLPGTKGPKVKSLF